MVVAVKLTAAFISGSVSVLGEGIQSLVDIIASGLAVWSIAYAARPPDESHPYGHGKAEVLSSAAQMVLMTMSSGFILVASWGKFLHPEPIKIESGALAMAYALVSNLTMVALLRRGAQKTGSISLRSEATHLLSDSTSSAGVLFGLVLIQFKAPLWIDPLVAILLACWAIFTAIRTASRLIHMLMDGALPDADVQLVKQTLDSHPEVRGHHNLRTRMVGSDRFVDLHVMLDDGLSFVTAHDLAEEIEGELKQTLGGAIVTIHYEPYESELEHRKQEHGETI